MLADQLGVAVAATLSTAGIEARVTTIELREHAHAIADALITGFASGTLAEAIAEVVGADGIIVVTPTFGATYSGLFKSFIDALEPDSLRDKPILLAATGGTERHSLMLDYALRPLLSHLKARPVPTAVYAATADFGGAGAVELASRVNAAAAELAAAVAPAHSAAPVPGSSVGGFVPFDQLLARVGADGVVGEGESSGLGVDTAYDRVRRAEKHLSERRFLEAVEELQLVMAEPDPGMPLTEARTMLARAYYGSAQLGRAEAMARLLLEDNPTDAYAARLVARSLQRQSRHDDAAPFLALAHALDG